VPEKAPELDAYMEGFNDGISFAFDALNMVETITKERTAHTLERDFGRKQGRFATDIVLRAIRNMQKSLQASYDGAFPNTIAEARLAGVKPHIARVYVISDDDGDDAAKH